MKTYTLSVLVENHSGVISRISGLFSRRGYNINSISVGEIDEEFSRITIVIQSEEFVFDQIKKQVEKLPVVIKVIELKPHDAVYRELILIKVSVTAEKRSEIVGIVDIFRANIIDLSAESVTIEMTGTQSKIEALLKLVEPYGLKEIVRTGVAGLERGNKGIKDDILS